MESSSQAAALERPASGTPTAPAAAYAAQEKIYPKAVTGKYRTLKNRLTAFFFAVFYLLPWAGWDRGSNAPHQAVLLDFDNQRFYFFFVELWPQQIYFFTGALILAAVGLFLATALAGRVWCGFGCPQTVWTDVFVAVERFFEGERLHRMRRDKGPWTADKLRRKAATHSVWLLISLATGVAAVAYFTDARALPGDLIAWRASETVLWFVAAFTAATYVMAGSFREQVCVYMCPWPRLQGPMVDEDSLIVTYDRGRGEGRGHLRRSQSWEERSGAGKGDCIDCNACVHSCPVGIDIRDGMQADCINCGLCVDACDFVMERVKRPAGLVRFDTQANMSAEKKPAFRLIRPRIIVYGLMLLTVAGAMTAGLLLRPGLQVSVLRDRAPLYVTMSNGDIANGYTVKIANMTRNPQQFVLTAAGPAGLRLNTAGGLAADGTLRLEAAPDTVATYRVTATLPAAGAQHAAVSSPATLVLTSAAGERVAYETVFITGKESAR
jgi:cytochrome c oxidase accessory protein FixG